MRASHHMHERAKALRRDMTPSEARLWRWLRNRTFAGFKFRRQVPIGPYVVDFFSPSLRLVIEVDGRQHEQDWYVDYESERTAFLRARGIEVVRITNELLAKDSLMAQDVILAAICARV